MARPRFATPFRPFRRFDCADGGLGVEVVPEENLVRVNDLVEFFCRFVEPVFLRH